MYNISFDTFQQDQTSNYNYKSETASIEHAVSPCRRSLRRLEDVKLHQTTRTCCQNYKKQQQKKKPNNNNMTAAPSIKLVFITDAKLAQRLKTTRNSNE